VRRRFCCGDSGVRTPSPNTFRCILSRQGIFFYFFRYLERQDSLLLPRLSPPPVSSHSCSSSLLLSPLSIPSSSPFLLWKGEGWAEYGRAVGFAVAPVWLSFCRRVEAMIEASDHQRRRAISRGAWRTE